jgi:hypothetical protein
MRIRRSARAFKLIPLLVLGAALLWGAPSSGAVVKSKSKFKLGDYIVKTSPALDTSSGPTVEHVRFEITFGLTACGKAYCLATAQRMGEYGTASTNGVAKCSTPGDPAAAVIGYGWMPMLRIPPSGELSVNKTVDNQGKPAAVVKATFKITPKGEFTGTFEETNYVSNGGPNFLGCTTGKLTLSGKWVQGQG